jgi:hypothetical protein
MVAAIASQKAGRSVQVRTFGRGRRDDAVAWLQY